MFTAVSEKRLYDNDRRLSLELAKICCYSREFVIFLLGFENVIAPYMMWLTDPRDCAYAESNVMIRVKRFVYRILAKQK